MPLPPIALRVGMTWDGKSIPDAECVDMRTRVEGEYLVVEIDAPFYNDLAPNAPVGSLDGLWDWEVAELFLLGSGERYLELEFGPHGHYLALELEGVRQVKRKEMTLSYDAQISGRRWHGVARVPVSWIPDGCDRVNATAIYGVGEGRRYLSWKALPGKQPDFHQLGAFGRFVE